MKRNSFRSRYFQKVMDYLRSEYCKGVRIVYYIPLSEAFRLPVSKLALMLMPIGGGSHGITLNGGMFHGHDNPPAL